MSENLTRIRKGILFEAVAVAIMFLAAFLPRIPLDLLREIFGNVSTIISFQVSRDDAGRLSKEFVTQYNGEVTNIPVEEILSLKVGQAYCKIGQHSFFMGTYLADQSPEYGRAEYIASRSRRGYSVKSQRPIEIATVRDRVVQMLLKMVLEPIYESDFLNCSNGFRPGRRTMDCVALMDSYINRLNKYY